MSSVDLRTVFPARAELPKHDPLRVRFTDRFGVKRRTSISPWRLDCWWSASRYIQMSGDRCPVATVYLNGHGTDHELRFTVQDWTQERHPCPECAGTGRVVRHPQAARANPFPALFGGRAEIPAEVPDADGKLGCLRCHGHKTVDPMVGAANCFCRVTLDLTEFYHEEYYRRLAHRDAYGLGSGSLGARGLGAPVKDDVFRILAWCDEQVEKFYPRDPTRPR